VIIRHVRKVGKIRFRVFPDVPFTKKGLEMPMGKGKGDVSEYKAKVKRGRVILEVSGLDPEMMAFVFKKASAKLPVKTRMVLKGEIN
jgi:large subunit ribosomal protein L16